MGPAREEPLSEDAAADVDFDIIRREVETEIADYLRGNEKMLTLIRQGQHIKAHIRHKKAGSNAIIMNSDKMRAPC
jgi:hypothetical protein